jgi:hypothetical protein
MATGLGQAGTYISVSSTNAETAFVQITGTPVWVTGPGGGKELRLTNITATLIDGSGNSLAGTSESTLEADFNTLDQISFGTNRSVAMGYVFASADYPTAINADFDDIAGHIPSWLDAQYGIQIVPANTTVTVVFPDQSSATFRKNVTWTWTGNAWNAQHQQIYQNGKLKNNPNTGGNGNGSTSVAGAGKANLSLGGEGECTTTTSVSWGGVYQGSETHFVPC